MLMVMGDVWLMAAPAGLAACECHVPVPSLVSVVGGTSR